MKVYMEAYGCTLNTAENEALARGLVAAGWKIVKKPETADLLILGTCTVIDTTERHMISRIRKLREYEKILVITGCMASAQPGLVRSFAPDAILLRPGDYGEILRVLGLSGEKILPEPRVNDVVAAVPIASGCTGRCSYCITRIARGKIKSVPLEELKREVGLCVRKGAREIRLTAQDTAAYGIDRGTNLAECIGEIAGIKGDFRLRVGMMNPRSVLPLLPALVSSYAHRKVFKFLHLPLQSGSDRILAHMHRDHTVEDFARIVNAFREKFWKFTLSTDIIVGYPSEEEADFDASLKIIERVKPDIVNVTRFSPRPGTPAARLKPITERIVKERSRQLVELRFQVSRKNLEKRIGKEEKVLVCERGKGGTFIARTVDYKPVIIEREVKLGSFVDVRIVGATDIYLISGQP
ncbi:MAG: tRNA (N(6)-L-threonylcarbamoyladenosine(37)-C(2))-methylthiotransferase [Thermoplasmata archaeon]|nr:tRNA (N(6)-L-threonylcarbamoyladenosine(37)-C(2))-methylthiotransferase [Thermoplasmata archaeon]